MHLQPPPSRISFPATLASWRPLHAVLLMLCGLPALAVAQNQQLTVDIATPTGPITHGATGWLYGQAESGIPSQNLMAPLKPQISAQKPPQGLQHPGGDILQVIGDYVAAGGQQEHIYMQDIYRTFYPDNGIADYISKVQTMMPLLVASPYHSHFVYNPFNEPDGEIYGQYGVGITNLPRFESDWMTIHKLIRSYDPQAIIAGPSFYNYDSTVYREFLTFAQANNVLPDQIVWHELQNNFFSGWYGRYNDYRSIESSLGISPRPIVINEYGESSGDLGVPGRLIQFISRFETSKVAGCLAYWTASGALAELGASTLANVPTGAWWLYKWYGGMTGDTLAVTPPNANAVGLSGVASGDYLNQQIRVLLGGGSGDVNVLITGVGAIGYNGIPVHVTMWGVDSSGAGPSSGPYYISEKDYTPAGGQLSVTVPNTQVSSAYYLILTPATSLSKVDTPNRYQAEYASLTGTAIAGYGGATGYTGTGYVQGYGTEVASTEFDVSVPSNGFYNVKLRYSSPGGRSLALLLNGQTIDTRELRGTKNSDHWTNDAVSLFLEAGINRIAYGSTERSGGVVLDSLDVVAAAGTITTYEAAAAANTLSGTVYSSPDTNAPGGSVVSFIGQGANNYLQFNNVNAPSAGLYRMLVTNTSAEKYNGSSDPVYRFAQISVNGAAATQVYFANTFSYSTYIATEVDVFLNAGNNTIRFSNDTTSPPTYNIDSGYAPNIAMIQIAPATF